MEKQDVQKLIDCLNRGRVEVIFTKLNGEKRTMHCTLNEMFLPKEWVGRGAALATVKTPQHERTAISVWDLDVNDWRSFRYESVQYYTMMDESVSPRQLLVEA